MASHVSGFDWVKKILVSPLSCREIKPVRNTKMRFDATEAKASLT